MNKAFRIIGTILAIALSLYLMVTLFVVFLVLLGIGLLYILFIRFFGKAVRPKENLKENDEGIIIEHEPIEKNDDVDERK